MKNYYFTLLLCLSLFGLTRAVAQSCPPTGFSDSTSLFFFYDTGTSDCIDRPTTVTVGASTFTLVDCGDAYSVYDLTSGSPIVPPNMFTADFGFGTCEYTNGVLTNETLSIEQVESIFNAIRIYPNPLMTGDNIHIKFGSRISVNVSLFDVTGKQVLSDVSEQLSMKPVNLANLPNGIYMLQIATKNVSITKKVVIMR